MRKKKGKEMTPLAQELILKELAKLSPDKNIQTDILNQSIMNN